MLGRAIDDPLEALSGLPEIAEGEPCPVLALDSVSEGWLSVWEVTPDGEHRSAVAVFQPDQGLVRPDLAATAWDRLSKAATVVDHRVPQPSEWARIVDEGVDHAYQAVARLAGPGGISLPDARLRLLVRTTG
jgi:hypothetical protein